MEYLWSQTSGIPGTFDATDRATVTWTSPATEGSAVIQVTVTDDENETTSATVTIAVTTRPPTPPAPPRAPPANRAPTASAACDPCELRPGGEAALTATASDPDGDELTYAWSASAGSFDGGTDGATARWRAPAETGRVTIGVTVSDGRRSAAAEVAVEVVNARPAFEASESAFELRENTDGSREPVDVGAVAAADPDGDELTYELAAGDPSRFTVGARDGAVRYVGPGEDFESESTRYELTVRARDPYDAEAEASVVVTVVDVNERPEAVDDEAATGEDQPVTVDVPANDADPDGDGLRVESVSAAAHGTTSVAGGGVLYSPAADYHGADRFTYVISDGKGATAEAAVEVTVAPVNDAPAAVGTIPDQSLDEGAGEATVELEPFFGDVDGDALAYRASSSDPAVATAAVAGSVLTLAPVAYGTALVTVTAEDEGGLTATQAFAVGVSDQLVRGVVGNTLAAMARSHLASARMTLGRRAAAGADEPSRLTVLGRRVPLEKAAAYDGQLRTAWLGVDTWLTARWLAGVAVARSDSASDWRAGGARGSLTSALTAVHPYVQWTDGTTSVWASAGGGWGAAENLRSTGGMGTSDLGLRLRMAELRRRLGARGGAEFSVRADAAWARLATGAGDETIDAQTAGVSQVRAGADVSLPVRLGGVGLAPFGEAHVRRDGGAGQTGTGLEVVGGVRAVRGLVRVDAQGRLLVLHSASGYRERGVGVTLSVGNQSHEGLSLSLAPRWGDQAAGGGALWQEQVYRRHVAAAAGDEWALDARGEYEMRLPSGRLLTWFGTVSHSPWGRRLVAGGRVGVLGDRPAAGGATPPVAVAR